MGRLPKFSTKGLAECAKRERDTGSPRAKLVHLAITEKVKKQYESRVRLFLAFDEETNGKKKQEKWRPAKETFFEYLWSMKKMGGRGSTAEGYRDALLHFSLCGEIEAEWAADSDVKKACAGFRYNSRKGEEDYKERGAIDEEMLEELVEWSKKRGRSHMTDGLQVQFGLGLRVSELIGLQAEDVKPAAGSVHIREDKRDNAKSMKK